MVNGTLALLICFIISVNVKQGSDPGRGQSPIEWGDFPSIRLFICSPVCPSRPSQSGFRASQAGLRASKPGLVASQPGLTASQLGLRASQPGSEA